MTLYGNGMSRAIKFIKIISLDTVIGNLMDPANIFMLHLKPSKGNLFL